MKKKKQKSAYSSSSTQNKTKSNKLKTGLVIGGVSLAVLALAGGLSAFFIGNNKNDNKTPIGIGSTVTDKADFAEYELPGDLNFGSFNVYNISDKFTMFTSSNVGTYILNEETKDFEYVSSSYLSSYSDEIELEAINGFRYFLFADYSFIRINIETGKFEKIDLNLTYNPTNFKILGFQNNLLYFKYYTTGISNYTFSILNTENNIVELEIKLSDSTQYNYLNQVIDIGDYYLGCSATGSSNYGSLLINKSSSVIISVANASLYSDNYVVKNNYLYGVFKNSSSGSVFGKIDLSTGIFTNISSYSYANAEIKELEHGLLIFKSYSVSNLFNMNSAYSTSRSLYYNFEDETTTELEYGGGDTFLTYYINDVVFYSISSSYNNNRSAIAVFNEDTLDLDIVYTSPASGSSGSAFITELKGKYYVYDKTSGTSYISEIEFLTDNAYKFNLLSISVTIDKGFEIKDNVYIFEGNTGICYYNFENDVFKRLINNTKISINEIQVEDNLVYIYCDDNIKYELNLDTIILKAVAYWE